MPAKSKAQQKAAGLALAAKKGEIDPSELKGAAKSMYKMKQSDLEKYAGTKHEGLPEKKKKEESVNESSDPYKLEPYVFDIIDELTRKGFSEDIIDNIILNDPATINMIYSALEHNISPRYVANELNAVYNDYVNENKNMNVKGLNKKSIWEPRGGYMQHSVDIEDWKNYLENLGLKPLTVDKTESGFEARILSGTPNLKDFSQTSRDKKWVRLSFKDLNNVAITKRKFFKESKNNEMNMKLVKESLVKESLLGNLKRLSSIEDDDELWNELEKYTDEEKYNFLMTVWAIHGDKMYWLNQRPGVLNMKIADYLDTLKTKEGPLKEEAFSRRAMTPVSDKLTDFSKKYGYLEPSLILRIQSMTSEGPKMGEKFIVEEYDGDYYIIGGDDVIAVLTKEGVGHDETDWMIYSNLSMDEIYRLVGLNESLNENDELPDLKRFKDVEKGDLALDYNDEESEVLDKIAYDDYNLDSVEKFLRMYDSTGAMQSGLEEGLAEPDEHGEIKMIAVYNPEDNASYVYTYGYDGAYVPEEFANEGSMNKDDDMYHTKFLKDRKKLAKKYKNDPMLKNYLDDFNREH